MADRNACEIKLFHQEDAGLNVKMAKLAFAKGIWSYVCKMENALRKYPTIRHRQTSSAANAVTLVKKVSVSFVFLGKGMFLYLRGHHVKYLLMLETFSHPHWYLNL